MPLLKERKLPIPTTSAGWDEASLRLAEGASGSVRVLQQEVRLSSTWKRIEFGALESNPNVTTITAINPEPVRR